MIKILVTDDEVEMLSGVKKLLTLSGFDVSLHNTANRLLNC